MGRPSSYTPEIASEICERLANGESVGEIIESSDSMPSRTTIFKWRNELPEFATMYARARESCADAYHDQIRKIYLREPRFINNEGDAEHQPVGTRYDTGDIQWMRLQIDSLKWQAAKLGPKNYADRQVAASVATTDEAGKKVVYELVLGKGETDAS